MSKTNTFWVFTHNFTNTGAPLVLADIVRELAAKGLQKQMKLISWGGKHDHRHSTLHHQLFGEGFSCQIFDLDSDLPRPRCGDRVLINSLAVPDHVTSQAQTWLEKGQINRLDWYAHEANPSIWLPHPEQRERLKLLLEKFNFNLFVPSEYILERYQKWTGYFGNQLSCLTPKLTFDQSIRPLFQRPIPSFDSLHFQLTAMAGAGQKGHLWLIRVLEQVLARQDAQQEHLRPVSLSFIGLEEGPYAAFTREVIRRAQILLGDSFHWTYHGTKSDALGAMANANLSVCCSLEETFSLVSVESMLLGQPLLRSRTGGWSEQLDPGINGFDLGLPGPDVRQEHVDLFHRLRDPEIFSNEHLMKMSHAARSKAQSFTSVTYSDWLLGE